MPDLAALWTAAMRRGDMAGAWALSDAVLAARDPARRDDPRLPYHERWVWDGRDFTGRHVLVRCYHGLGDSLQFLRLLPLLRGRVASLAVEVQPDLLALLADLPGPDRLIPFRPEAPAPPVECDIESMELAHALRIAPASLPPVPYLGVPTGRITAARARLATARIGLCWRAGDWDPGRSVPLRLLARACAAPGRRFVSLQRGPAAEEAAAPQFVNPRDRCRDVVETAALIMALDLVITVDTMVAHLAGALGRPAWLLLQADADWRWMTGRPDSPWYPSMRLYRQRVAGDWRHPLACLAADLKRRMEQPDA
ncbi:MAG: hypothetical protein JO209_01385 [Acidisphaera sp.]|nr:hypothetical protein [Acidisphaera sp.]